MKVMLSTLGCLVIPDIEMLLLSYSYIFKVMDSLKKHRACRGTLESWFPNRKELMDKSEGS